MKRYTIEKEVTSFGEKYIITEPNLVRIAIDATIALITLFLLLLYWPLQSVPTGYRGVITQFGAIKAVADEGLTFVPPYQRLNIFSIRADQVDVKNAEGATSDTQPVHVNMTVRYSIDPKRVTHIFENYSHTGDLDNFIDTASHETFKAVTANYSASDLIIKRQLVSDSIKGLLQKKVDQYGAIVVNIDMTGFAFSKDYMAAINDKVTQEQKKLAADNKLKTVEAEQKQKVAIAEAEASAVKAQADGDAYAKLVKAKADAESLRITNNALQQSKDVLELRRIEVELAKANKWNGALPQNIYAGAPVPFLNLNKQ